MPARRLLFLDIDGVLHPFDANGQDKKYFVDTCIAELQHIVQKTGAEIVLSSSWRQKDELRQEVAEELAKHGLSFSRWTCTVRSGSYRRAKEIMRFIREEEQKHGHVIFAILDDDEIVNYDTPVELLSRIEPSWIHTDPHVGLTVADSHHAVEVLLGEEEKNLHGGDYYPDLMS